jgi:hypothetical protein
MKRPIYPALRSSTVAREHQITNEALTAMAKAGALSPCRKCLLPVTASYSLSRDITALRRRRAESEIHRLRQSAKAALATALARSSACDFRRRVAGAIETLFADHVQYRRRPVNLGQYLTRQGARIGTLKLAMAIPHDKTAAVFLAGLQRSVKEAGPSGWSSRGTTSD